MIIIITIIINTR